MVTGRVSVAALALPLALIAGCGGDKPIKEAEGGTDAAVASQSAEPITEGDVKEFVELLTNGEAESIESALKMTYAGSVANAFAQHEGHLNQALLDAGEEYGAEEVSMEDGTVTSCSGEGEDEVCTKYADFESKSGKIASFTVNGKSIGDRVSLGDGSTVKAGNLARVQFLSAYRTTSSGDLRVIVELKALKTGITSAPYTAKYRSPKGRQTKASQAASVEVGADSVSNQVFVFPNAEAGGSVSWEIYDTSFERTAVVTLKTR